MVFVIIIVCIAIYFTLNQKEKTVYSDSENYFSRKHNYFINYPDVQSIEMTPFYTEKKKCELGYYFGPGEVSAKINDEIYMVFPTKLGKHYFGSLDKKNQIMINIKVNNGELLITDYSIDGECFRCVADGFHHDFIDATSIEKICMYHSALQFEVNYKSRSVDENIANLVDGHFCMFPVINRLIERKILFIDVVGEEIYYHFNCTLKELELNLIDLINEFEEKYSNILLSIRGERERAQ